MIFNDISLIVFFKMPSLSTLHVIEINAIGVFGNNDCKFMGESPAVSAISVSMIVIVSGGHRGALTSVTAYVPTCMTKRALSK